ncbi:MAG: hypothetical protein MJ014_01410, partial [Methanocorpusculum sp.]|nr:hypothetical protein [Methanocorpusculum sp.]
QESVIKNGHRRLFFRDKFSIDYTTNMMILFVGIAIFNVGVGQAAQPRPAPEQDAIYGCSVRRDQSPCGKE